MDARPREGYHVRYRRLYEALKRMGLSPAKVVECLIDAKRGHEFAIAWCRYARKHGRD